MNSKNKPKECPKCGQVKLFELHQWLSKSKRTYNGVECAFCHHEVWYDLTELEYLTSDIKDSLEGLLHRVSPRNVKHSILNFFRNIKNFFVWGWRLKSDRNWDASWWIEMSVVKLGDMAHYWKKEVIRLEKKVGGMDPKEYEEDWKECFERTQNNFRQICHLRRLLKGYSEIDWVHTKLYMKCISELSKNNYSRESIDHPGCWELMDRVSPERKEELRVIMDGEYKKSKLLQLKKYAEIHKALKYVPHWWD